MGTQADTKREDFKFGASGVILLFLGPIGWSLLVWRYINHRVGVNWKTLAGWKKLCYLPLILLTALPMSAVCGAALSASRYSSDTSTNSIAWQRWNSAVEQSLALTNQADGRVTQIYSRTGAWSQADANDALAAADLYARASGLLKATNAAPGAAPYRQELIDLESTFEGLYRELGLTVNPTSAYLDNVSQRDEELNQKWADLSSRYDAWLKTQGIRSQ